MKVEVVSKPAFAVLGIEGRGPSNRGPEWVMPLWRTAVGRMNEIRQLIIGNGWGLMSAVDVPFGPWTDEGKYLAGWEVGFDTQAPPGWTIWKVPASTFGVVPCTMKTYGEVWKFFNEEFLPDSGYERAGAAQEYYPPEFSDINKDWFYLYFMIKTKAGIQKQ